MVSYAPYQLLRPAHVGSPSRRARSWPSSGTRTRRAGRVMVAEQVEVKRLLFVDEMGTNTSLSAVYAWAKKGQRAHCSVPRNRGANTTVLSSMSAEEIGPSLTVEGTITSVVFEAYVEQVLAPTLCKGQVVVMDNLSAHKRRKGTPADRRARLPARLPAGLLSGSQPYRGGLLEDQGACA